MTERARSGAFFDFLVVMDHHHSCVEGTASPTSPANESSTMSRGLEIIWQESQSTGDPKTSSLRLLSLMILTGGR
jgi:hypothetical protein